MAHPSSLLQKKILHEGVANWEHSIIAQFLDKPHALGQMQRTLSKLWEKKGSAKISYVGDNMFILKFDDDEICSLILDSSPWHVQQNIMILRRWTSNAGKLHLDLNKVLLWFHLHHVPLELYNQKGISYITSAIGNPLYMNKTTNKNHLAYARVCVEACTEKDPPEMIDVELDDGNITSIAISILWKPYVCKTCNVFGHSGFICSKKEKRVWKVKEKVNTDLITEATIIK